MKNERLKFESRFDTEVKEIMVLTQNNAGAGKVGNSKLWDVSIKVLAYIDVKSSQIFKKGAELSWQLTDEQCKTKEKIFDLSGEKIYRLNVRESLSYGSDFTNKTIERRQNLMVLEVLERDCKNSQLEEILREYQRPVMIHPDGCDELLLDKYLGMFDGNCQWNGDECLLHLDVDEEGMETAEDAVETFTKMIINSAMWDGKARSFAASKLVENANEWQADDEEDMPEITEEDFAKRLGISELCIATGGNFEIYYFDDDMFWGHVIIVSGNIENGLEEAEIAG